MSTPSASIWLALPCRSAWKFGPASLRRFRSARYALVKALGAQIIPSWWQQIRRFVVVIGSELLLQVSRSISRGIAER